MYLYEAALDGQNLSAIAPEIILLDVVERAPEEDKQTAVRALRPGLLLAHRMRQSLAVELVLMIRTQDVGRRAAVMRAITEWAWGTRWLTLNTHPDERLRVTPEEPPVLGSASEWTEKITLTLTAYERPYWENEEPTTVTVTTEEKALRFPGSVGNVVEVTATNTGADALTALTLTCGKTFFSLSGLNVPPGETVEIRYTDDSTLQILAGGVSAMANRDAASSDDLYAEAGVSTMVSAGGDQSVSAAFRVRGRWL